MKKLTKGKMWLFAIGQGGYAILSGLIGSFLIYVYQPTAEFVAQGQVPLIPQGKVIFGILTILGLIAAAGRIFDAVTDPMIASWSDKLKHKDGRRIPFLRWASLPLAVVTVLVFCAPFSAESAANGVWLFIMVALYYLLITAYCTPFTALYAELGNTQEERIFLSTCMSLTFIVGTAVAYVAPSLWGIFIGMGMPRYAAIRLAMSILAVLSTIGMFCPVWFIRESDYVEAKPVESTAIQSLAATFKNRDFRIFVSSDIFYWIGLTMFQTGLPFFVSTLMHLDESWNTILFVGMTAVSLVWYVPINMATAKLGKKKMVLFAFCMFTLTFAFTSFTGNLPMAPVVQGVLVCVCGSLPMAIFGILPQAMVADVAEYEGKETGENRQGMFFAARTFCFKLGQSLAMLLFTSISTLGGNGVTTEYGVRTVAIVSAVLCLIGGLLLLAFNEKKIMAKIAS
ncbi:MAG: MFS transporter [Treponemataceae bacterium]|nr:MFS transporter [Treponemataceae bacterium]